MVGVSVGVKVALGVKVWVAVKVALGVKVWVGVAVLVDVAVGVAVGAAVRHAARARVPRVAVSLARAPSKVVLHADPDDAFGAHESEGVFELDKDGLDGADQLQPGEEADLPVVYFVDPEIVNDPDAREIETVTLSYTYFRSTTQAAAQPAAQASDNEG